MFVEKSSASSREGCVELKLPNHMQGWSAMRTRKSFTAAGAGIIAVLMVAPAQAGADSFPEKASDYVSDNTGYFVAALLAAILLLLLIVRISQRRAKEKERKRGAQPGGPPPAGAPAIPPPGAPPAPVSAPTAE